MINLRSSDKVKFVQYKRQYEKYLKSPLSHGITMWDRFPAAVKTEVKFKVGIKPHLTTLVKPTLR